jgi:hypothetical protein
MDKSSHATKTMTGSWHHLRVSIGLVRAYIEPVILVALLPTLTLQLSAFLGGTTLGQAVYYTGVLWTFLSLPAQIYLQVHAAKHQPVTTTEAYGRGIRFLLPTLGITLLTSLIILGGPLLLVSLSYAFMPQALGMSILGGIVLLGMTGFIFLPRYVLAPYYVIDKGLGVLAAMRQSTADSKQSTRYIWGSIGVFAVVVLASLIAGILVLFLPGASEIVASLVGLMSMFIFALRYIEVSHNNHKTASSDS